MIKNMVVTLDKEIMDHKFETKRDNAEHVRKSKVL